MLNFFERIESLEDGEKATRSDIRNDAFTIDDIAESYGIDKSKISIVALVSSFIPINLAGITLVSFNTKTSPFSK